MALCEAAIAATSEADEACNDQIRRAWEELLAAVRISPARRFLIRNWSVPVAGAVVLPKLEAMAVPAVSLEPLHLRRSPAAEELGSSGY